MNVGIVENQGIGETNVQECQEGTEAERGLTLQVQVIVQAVAVVAVVEAEAETITKRNTERKVPPVLAKTKKERGAARRIKRKNIRHPKKNSQNRVHRHQVHQVLNERDYSHTHTSHF